MPIPILETRQQNLSRVHHEMLDLCTTLAANEWELILRSLVFGLFEKNIK